MVSSKCVLLLSIVWCVGTLGQFFQDEVFVDVEDYAEQCDTVAKENEIFLVHFRGFLPDGTEFFSSYDLPHPVVLLPENTQTEIKGLRKGIVGMCVGEVRSITVPAYLGYGDQEHITKKGIKIPANSELVYQVRLLFTNDADQLGDAFDAIDNNRDGYLDRQEIRYQLAILEGEAAATDMGFGEEDANEKLVELMFTNNDKDQDGRLSRSEYLGVIYRDGEL